MTLNNLTWKEWNKCAEENNRSVWENSNKYTTSGEYIIPKMDPKKLTNDKLWDGYWLEEKYPHKFKNKKNDTKR